VPVPAGVTYSIVVMVQEGTIQDKRMHFTAAPYKSCCGLRAPLTREQVLVIIAVSVAIQVGGVLPTLPV